LIDVLIISGYSIVAEIPATRVRSQTVALARMCYILSQAALQQLFPRFLTAKPDGWDIGGKCGFLFVGLNVILATYCFFRLPETIGRTFGEIDILFQNKVSARRFASTKVDGQ
jgi:SP family general alpha glucoside:H+ symporter-like MFS transporter